MGLLSTSHWSVTYTSHLQIVQGEESNQKINKTNFLTMRCTPSFLPEKETPARTYFCDLFLLARLLWKSCKLHRINF